jgi:hypothetical protein
MIKKNTKDDVEIGFDGDNKDKIKDFILNNIKIDENLIKIHEVEKQEQSEKTENNILEIINKKISLQFVKVNKRIGHTYIKGLKNFLNEEELETTKKNLQKSLGTNSCANEDGDYGFNGDYISDSAKKTIIKTCILKNPKIHKDLFDF